LRNIPFGTYGITMISPFQPDNPHALPNDTLPAIPSSTRSQRHLQGDFHPRAAVVRIEDPLRPALSDRIKKLFCQLQGGRMGTRGEEDVSIPPCRFSSGHGQTGMSVSMRLSVRVASGRNVQRTGSRKEKAITRTHVNQLALPSKRGFNML
jgi:hypothetical protein